MTNREVGMWLLRIKEQRLEPTKTELYLAQVSLEIRRLYNLIGKIENAQLSLSQFFLKTKEAEKPVWNEEKRNRAAELGKAAMEARFASIKK